MARGLHHYVSGIRPLLFMLVYLAIIPVFAIVYCALPGQQFYAPYAKMEPPAVTDAAKVGDDLRTSMMESYRGYEVLADGWQISRSDVSVGDIAADASGGLSFTVYFVGTLHRGGQIIASTGGPQFTARLSAQKIVTQHRPGWMVCHLVTLPQGADAGGPAVFNQHVLFRSPEPSLQADMICWGGQQELRIQGLLAGWAGDPRGLSGFFWQMLYFSATTITTVGYGDIVPLTTLSRLLTAVEAIAGWVMAGLFLNALAIRISDQRTL